MKIKFIFLILIVICNLFPKLSLAQSFTSPSYHIDWGNFNITGGKKSSANYILTDSVGQNAPGQYDSAGYIVKAGFQYAYDQKNKFSFAIDNLNIDFGTLNPNTSTTQTNNLTITNTNNHGYNVLASENSSLIILDTQDTIPDTTCDNNDCDQNTSGIWTQESTYGFGFNANGDGTSNYFTDSTYFRQFANQQLGEAAQIFMSENSAVEEHTAQITYKVNIPFTQASGSYETNINFIAIPKY